ncbi:MAG: PBP1A family penicillin-binding protein [Candidatus Coatesbacteria bacterium]|nr:PBP1A family penicillin-binding protein [Candidatus Coatesbacteria bacterium]
MSAHHAKPGFFRRTLRRIGEFFKGLFRRPAPRRDLEGNIIEKPRAFSWHTAIIIVVVSSFFIGGVGLGLISGFSKDLPKISGLWDFDSYLPTEVYDANDQLIASFLVERRYVVPLSEMPANLLQATLAVEDQRFYDHWGVNLYRTMEAAVVDIIAGAKIQGASTITQQLARNYFLTMEKTYVRKIREAILAVQIEKRYSKEEILYFYLNQIYYGHGCYGVEAAARTFFNKHVGELTLPEAALLAGLPKNPGGFSPYLNPDRAKRRRNTVLWLMAETGVITEQERAWAAAQPLELAQRRRSEQLAPYFIEYIRSELEREYGSNAVYQSGMQVYTTLDLGMQRIAEKHVAAGLERVQQRWNYQPRRYDDGLTIDELELGQIREGRVLERDDEYAYIDLGNDLVGRIDITPLYWHWPNPPEVEIQVGSTIAVKVVSLARSAGRVDLALEKEPYPQAALVTIDPRTGFIKAMVGGSDFNESQFNRAVYARRQPGSAFKVFVYTAAIDSGYSAADVMLDKPFVINADGVVWAPHNYSLGYSGKPMTFRTAMAMSINLVAARLILQIGVEPVRAYAQRMGINSPIAHTYSIALGSSEVTPLEMASAFGTIATLGIHVEPTAIRYILDRDGNTIKEVVPRAEVALRKETAAIIRSMMHGVTTQGTAGRATRTLGRDCAGKTGTTNNAEDCWFIGYVPQLCTAVWVGFDDHTTLGYNATGESHAVPLWSDYMAEVLQDYPEEPFTLPEGLRLVRHTVCADTGLLATPDCPHKIAEDFIEGTEPLQFCDLHGSGSRDWLTEDATEISGGESVEYMYPEEEN